MIYPVNKESLSLAAEAIRRGELAAFPTETVYGLGGDAFNPPALAKIFQAKGRPRFDPLIVHIASPEALGDVADLSALGPEGRDAVIRLIGEFWPGPLTLVLPKQKRIPDLATSGLATVAVRFPSHPAALELIRLSTGAVAAPSANRFGCLSPTRAEHVAEQLGDRVGIILDGGACALGLESTVLDMASGRPRILRPGGLSRERLEALLGPLAGSGEAFPARSPEGPHLPGELDSPEGRLSPGGPHSRDGLPPPGELRSPGLLTSHYAPRTPLYLHGPGEMAALPALADAAYLFFSRSSCESWARGKSPGGVLEILSETGDLPEAAANLFAALHRLDKLGLRCIHAEKAPPETLGEAINDRLSRAAARPEFLLPETPG
ncbi:MAG: threonylcarbamoyl-AMP synthase [Treponema sp.]|jgi:L-threonylcarbamoyladenylate synthase|nr:threonylcarbamoyl-AMP synthase [Treponema sp.]